MKQILKGNSNLSDYTYFIASLPGQPLTIFHPKKDVDNIYIAGIYDRLLSKVLHELGSDFDKLELNFVGFGIGALNAATLSSIRLPSKYYGRRLQEHQTSIDI